MRSSRKVSSSQPNHLPEYRKTACLANRDHVDLHHFREGHTATGELGVMVRTYEEAKDRAQRKETLYKSQLPDRVQWNEKR